MKKIIDNFDYVSDIVYQSARHCYKQAVDLRDDENENKDYGGDYKRLAEDYIELAKIGKRFLENKQKLVGMYNEIDALLNIIMNSGIDNWVGYDDIFEEDWEKELLDECHSQPQPESFERIIKIITDDR